MEYNYKISINYDGGRYEGWQRQKGRLTIQETLEDCIGNICGEKIAFLRKALNCSQRALADKLQLLGLEIDKNAIPINMVLPTLNFICIPPIFSPSLILQYSL